MINRVVRMWRTRCPGHRTQPNRAAKPKLMKKLSALENKNRPGKEQNKIKAKNQNQKKNRNGKKNKK